MESVRVNEAPLCSFYPRPSTVDDELRTLKITAAQRLTGFMGHRVNEDLDRGFIGESVQFVRYIYIYYIYVPLFQPDSPFTFIGY